MNNQEILILNQEILQRCFLGGGKILIELVEKNIDHTGVNSFQGIFL